MAINNLGKTHYSPQSGDRGMSLNPLAACTFGAPINFCPLHTPCNIYAMPLKRRPHLNPPPSTPPPPSRLQVFLSILQYTVAVPSRFIKTSTKGYEKLLHFIKPDRLSFSFSSSTQCDSSIARCRSSSSWRR